LGYNPAALSALNVEKYKANQQVGAEEFRLNQGMKDKVYGENRNILNQSKLQNLQILDNQYQRQNQAKSNTKAVAQDALSSISDKFLKNKLENRTLQTYENMYNYRYDDKGRAWNMNAPAQFSMSGSGMGGGDNGYGAETGWRKLYDENHQFDRYVRKGRSKNEYDSDYTGANGTILKAYKTN